MENEDVLSSTRARMRSCSGPRAKVRSPQEREFFEKRSKGRKRRVLEREDVISELLMLNSISERKSDSVPICGRGLRRHSTGSHSYSERLRSPEGILSGKR